MFKVDVIKKNPQNAHHEKLTLQETQEWACEL